MRYFTILLIATAALLTGCNKKQPAQQMPPQNMDAMSAHDVSSVAGIHWSRPTAWGVMPPRQMRVTTYSIPAAEGDAEGAECGVFHFGSGQGGDLQANIARWVQQFENGKLEQSKKEVNGLNVTLVQIAGAYLAPSGPMMQSSGKKDNFRLLGAIVEAPEGSVFFKLTGPAKTVGACQGDFDKLVGSFAKQ
jgi:hypothetical protein